MVVVVVAVVVCFYYMSRADAVHHTNPSKGAQPAFSITAADYRSSTCPSSPTSTRRNALRRRRVPESQQRSPKHVTPAPRRSASQRSTATAAKKPIALALPNVRSGPRTQSQHPAQQPASAHPPPTNAAGDTLPMGSASAKHGQANSGRHHRAQPFVVEVAEATSPRLASRGALTRPRPTSRPLRGPITV